MAEPVARPKLPEETGKGVDHYYKKAEQQLNSKQNNDYDTKASVVSSPDLHEIRPDYAFLIKIQGEDSTRVNVNKLVNALVKQGIYVQVRQGNPGSLLVLAKCSEARLRAQATSTNVKEWLYGIRSYSPIEQRERGEDEESWTPAQRLRLVYDIITSADAAGVTPGNGEWKFVSSVFPLHDYELNRNLLKKWSTKLVINDQDIETIRTQFGDKVALYFAFVQHYFYWGLVPAVIGAVTHFIFGAYSIVFAVLNTLWGIIFIESWKRRQAKLAIKWDTKGCSLVKSRRIEFKAEKTVRDVITGEEKPYYANWKRNLKRFSFLPVASVAAIALVTFQSAVFVFEIFIAQIYDGPFKQYLMFVPTVLLVVLVPVFTAIYTVFVNKFTNWENHETSESYEFSHSSKQFVFNFLTAFMALFLTAYIYLPFGHLIIDHLDVIRGYVTQFGGSRVPTVQEFELNSWRLHQQVIYFIGTAQVIAFMLETVVPFVQRKVLSGAKRLTVGALDFSDHPDESKFMSDVRVQADLPEYNVNEDYRQLVVQFGYTVLFGPVWSLCPVAAAVNNFIQLRGDAAKICIDTKRPVPTPAENIGIWSDSLSFLSWLGSLTCASIIAMFGGHLHGTHTLVNGSNQITPTSSLYFLLAVVFGAENLYFLARRVIAAVFNSSETPDSIEQRKVGYHLRARTFNEKRSVIAARSQDHLHPSEVIWAEVSNSELEQQLSDALAGPTTLKDKKNK